MIDIIGNIKIDERKPERIKQLLACIKSYAFIADQCRLHLSFFGPSSVLVDAVANAIDSVSFSEFELLANYDQEYGDAYCRMLASAKHPFVLNFMEDQFMMLDNASQLMHLISFMKQYNVDVCKASFHQVEQNSIGGIAPIANVGVAMAFNNDLANHAAYCRHYGERYYIGCNFLTTREFAIKFWNRQMGPRPHEYEVPKYDPAWQHICAIPHIELQAAIDDDHGEPGSSLLQRPGAQKFWNIYNTL